MKRLMIVSGIVVSMCLYVLPVFGVTEFKDGGIHNVDYQTLGVWVDFQSPGMQTTVNLLDGAHMPNYYNLEAFENSRVNVFGGLVSQDLYAYDHSQITMSGGVIGYSLYAYNYSKVNISGGATSGLFAGNTSQVSMSGGKIYAPLTLVEYAILTIDGSNFAVDGQSVVYSELTSIYGGFYQDEYNRHLTGTLANGEQIANDFRIGQNAKIVLIPEPATLLLLGLGAVILRRKR